MTEQKPHIGLRISSIIFIFFALCCFFGAFSPLKPVSVAVRLAVASIGLVFFVSAVGIIGTKLWGRKLSITLLVLFLFGGIYFGLICVTNIVPVELNMSEQALGYVLFIVMPIIGLWYFNRKSIKEQFRHSQKNTNRNKESNP